MTTAPGLAASGLPVVLLRNPWYFENYTGQVATVLERGVVLAGIGDLARLIGRPTTTGRRQ